MKPRKVVVAGALAVLIAYGSYSTIEILKLNNRVDELTQETKAKDVILQKAHDGWEQDVKKLDESKVEINRLKELNIKANNHTQTLQTEVDKLTQQLKNKEKEIKELKKTKPVSTLDGTVVGNNFEVTWYNDYGVTKSGRFVKDGVTVAVDPKVIPLGTWLRLEFPDGRVLTRRADDTGGAVKGHIVDIYDNASTKTLLQRGRTHGVKVTIVNEV